LSAAVESYIAQLPTDERQLLDGLLNRAETLFTLPSRRTEKATEPGLILVVDDNESTLFARAALLRAEGFQVVEAVPRGTLLSVVQRLLAGAQEAS
jgi:hypothetical protein